MWEHAGRFGVSWEKRREGGAAQGTSEVRPGGVALRKEGRVNERE